MTNTLYYGDNLPILREYFADASVDLIYLDPPFNSNRSYNVLFKDESGRDSDAQITAFEDSWHWQPSTEALYHELLRAAPERLARVLSALIESLGRSNQICAYLVMMAARLSELRRVLKPGGSIYLHCDPTASHYLRLMMDTIFGEWNYRNEIVWKRLYGGKSDAGQYGRSSDRILYYSKSEDFHFDPPRLKEHDEKVISTWYNKADERGKYVSRPLTAAGATEGDSGQPWRGIRPTGHWTVPRILQKRYEDDTGNALQGSVRERLEILAENGYIDFSTSGLPSWRRYLEEAKPPRVQDIWADEDVKPIARTSKERLGYPTQKPRALLERIINASSNPGDLVLDPFCGCGTAIDAAHALGRRWAGIDITHLSVALMKYRLRDRYGLQPGQDYEVIGEPTTLAGARQLASEDRYQFQWWALSLVSAKPVGAPAGARRGKKGADQGIDGVIHFLGDGGKAQRVIIQVKSGGVNSGDIRDLRGALEREGAALAAFITLEAPSKPMATEALAAGYYETEAWGNFPRLQLLTIEGLLTGAQELAMPREYGTFRRAARAEKSSAAQKTMRMG